MEQSWSWSWRKPLPTWNSMPLLLNLTNRTFASFRYMAYALFMDVCVLNLKYLLGHKCPENLAPLPWADPRPIQERLAFCSFSAWLLLTQYFADWHFFHIQANIFRRTFASRESLIRLQLYSAINWVCKGPSDLDCLRWWLWSIAKFPLLIYGFISVLCRP